MFKSKFFWFLARNTVVMVWAVLILLAFRLPPSGALIFKTALVVMLLIHLAELPISLSIGNQKELPKGEIFFKTVCYGFTWWLPLRMNLIER